MFPQPIMNFYASPIGHMRRTKSEAIEVLTACQFKCQYISMTTEQSTHFAGFDMVENTLSGINYQTNTGKVKKN